MQGFVSPHFYLNIVSFTIVLSPNPINSDQNKNYEGSQKNNLTWIKVGIWDICYFRSGLDSNQDYPQPNMKAMEILLTEMALLQIYKIKIIKYRNTLSHIPPYKIKFLKFFLAVVMFPSGFLTSDSSLLKDE